MKVLYFPQPSTPLPHPFALHGAISGPMAFMHFMAATCTSVSSSWHALAIAGPATAAASGPKTVSGAQRLPPQPGVLVVHGPVGHGGRRLGRRLGAQVGQRHQRLPAEVAARMAQHLGERRAGVGCRPRAHDR